MADELEVALAEAKRRKSEKERARDDGIRRVWEAFWGVWGPPREQEKDMAGYVSLRR